MSIFTKFATVSDYPKGLMNLCQCGQVILAPATIHENCLPTGNCWHTACGRGIGGKPIVWANSQK
jgi:hypothetical protein